MSSLVTRPNGHRWLQFFFNDTRHTLRLGKLSKRNAVLLQARLDSLVSAKTLSIAPDATVLDWLQSIPDTMHERIASTGLVEPRMRFTLREFLESATDSITDVSSGTRDTYRQAKRNLLEYFDATKRIADITERDAQNFRDWLAKSGKQSGGHLATATVTKRIKLCRQFFTLAVNWGAIPANPFSSVRIGPDTNQERMRFIPAEWIDIAMDATHDIDMRVILAMARWGGLRIPSEINALEWRHVHWDRDRITIPSQKTSRHGKDVRIIPMYQKLRPTLERAWELAPDGATHVLQEHGISGALIRKRTLQLLHKCGLEPWPKLYHNLRATRVTELINRFPANVVADWMGHSIKVALSHYTMVTSSHFDDAIDEIEGAAKGEAVIVRQDVSNDTF